MLRNLLRAAAIALLIAGVAHAGSDNPAPYPSIVGAQGNSPILVSGFNLNIQNSSTSFDTLYHSLHAGFTTFNGLQVALVNPLGSTVSETDPFNLQLANYAVHVGGNPPQGNAVGYRGDVYTLTDGGFTWWSNPGLSDSLTSSCAGCGARDLEYAEVDVGIKSSSTTFHGLVFTGSSTANPAAASAVHASSLSGGTDSTTGLSLAQYNPAPFIVDSGVTTVAYSVGSLAHPAASVTLSPSEQISFSFVDNAGVGQSAIQEVLPTSASAVSMLFKSASTPFGLSVSGTGAPTNLTVARTDASLTDGANVGSIFATAPNGSGTTENWSQINTVALTTGAGVETGEMRWFLNNAGSLVSYMTLTPTALTLATGMDAVIPQLTVQGALSANAWGANGLQMNGASATLTDLNSSGTVATNYDFVFNAPTLTANSATTYTSAGTVYISGAPIQGSNVTITNGRALVIASGQALLSGGLTVNGGPMNFTSANASSSLSPTGSGSVTINPATTGNINAMNIGATTRGTGAFTTLAANSTLTLTGISNAAGNEILCYNTSGGAVTYENAVAGCVPSALRLKNPSSNLNADAATKGLDELHPAVWTYKDEKTWGDRPYVGLYADDVEKMDPRCAVHNKDGQLENYQDRCVIAYLVAVVQNQQRQIDELRGGR